MKRLTKRGPRISGRNGICCAHLGSYLCYSFQGNCSDGCPWDEMAWERLAAYEDIGLAPEEINRILDVYGRGMKLGDEVSERVGIIRDISTDRLKELAQAEKDERLMLLPVPVGEGNRVYGICNVSLLPTHIATIECDHLDRLEIFPSGEIVVEVDGWEIGESDIGKTVFLTREDAEAALTKKQ